MYVGTLIIYAPKYKRAAGGLVTFCYQHNLSHTSCMSSPVTVDITGATSSGANTTKPAK